MTPFSARVRREGAKTSLCITVPAPIAKQLSEVGLRAPGWVRLCVEGHEPVFVFARKPPSRLSVIVTLPTWAFGTLPVGTEVQASVQDATPYRARQRADQPPLFDWLTHVDLDAYLPVDGKRGTLQLHSRYEQPFSLLRCPDPQIVNKLCARGVPSGRDYTVTGPEVAAVATLLGRIGVTNVQRSRTTLRVPRSQPLVRLLRRWSSICRGSGTKENARVD